MIDSPRTDNSQGPEPNSTPRQLEIDRQSPGVDYQNPNLGVKNRVPEAQNGILLA